MAVILAYAIPGFEPAFSNPLLGAGTRSYGFDYWPRYDYETNLGPAYVSVASQLPVTVNPVALSGYHVLTRFDDYYNRIHIVPSKLELGNVVGGTIRTVDLWNAFLTSKLMSDFEPPSDEGIAVTEPFATPALLGPCQLVMYTLTFSNDAAATINDAMTWTIDGLPYELPITGLRAVVWPFSPNWSARVDETLEWSTAVDRAYDGTEQRISLRAVPRRSLEYAVRAVGIDAQFLDNLIHGWAGRLNAIPIWMEKTKLTAPAAAGASALSFDTTNRTFVADGIGVLIGDTQATETFEVASATASGVTLKKPLVGSWPSGTPVFPMMLARLENNVAVARPTDSILEMAARFHGAPGEADPRIPVVAAPATYLGYELYLHTTNWIDGTPFDFESDHLVVDSETGLYVLQKRAENIAVQKRHRWLLKSAAEITTFRAWLGRRKGRAVPVWMPTGLSDMTLNAPITSVDTSIAVKANGFDLYGVGNAQRKHILIRLRSGAYYAREVVGAAAGVAGTVNVSLASAVGVAIQPSEVKMISFLGLWRLAADAVVIGYETASVATVEATMRLTAP